MKENQLLTDTLITAGGESFACHKLILCVSSSFLRQVFINNPQKDDLSNEKLQHIDKSIFTPMLEYMYTGKIEVDLSNIEELFQAQELLQLIGFEAECTKSLTGYVKPNSCIWLHRLAKQYKYEGIAQKARAVMLRHFVEVAATQDFLAMTEQEVTEYLSDDGLEVQSEEMVYNALMKWVCAKSEEREGSFTSIVQCVRFPYSSWDFLHRVGQCEQLMDNVICQKLLNAAMYFQQAPEQRQVLVKPRDCHLEHLTGKLVVLAGLCIDDATDMHCRILADSSFSIWEEFSDLPRNLRGISVCLTQRGIVVTGGRKGCKAMKDCFLLDIKSGKKSWMTLPPMAQARCNHKSLYYNNAVYVIGGWNKRCIDTVEKINLQGGAWSKVAPLKTAVQQPMVTVCCYNPKDPKERLLAFGGHNGSSWLCCTQEYLGEELGWTLLKEMPEPCMAGDAVSIGGQVLIVGGWNKCCVKYDLTTNNWTQLTRPSEKHWHAPALTWNRRILVGGGYQSTTVEQYDPEADSWTKRDLTMPKELWKHQMLSICLPLSSHTQAPEPKQESVEPMDFQWEWPRGTPVIIGGASDENQRISNRTCWYLQGEGSESTSWEILTEVPHELVWVSACATPSGILVTGGNDTNHNSYKDYWLFQCRKKQWTKMPLMASGRSLHASLCYHNSKVYVAGG